MTRTTRPCAFAVYDPNQAGRDDIVLELRRVDPSQPVNMTLEPSSWSASGVVCFFVVDMPPGHPRWAGKASAGEAMEKPRTSRGEKHPWGAYQLSRAAPGMPRLDSAGGHWPRVRASGQRRGSVRAGGG